MKFRKERPSKDVLVQLVTQNKSLKEIGEVFNVTIGKAAHWIKSYNIERIRSIGRPKGVKSPQTSGQNNPRYGKPGTFLGKTHSIETKQLMSENHADFNGDNNPFRNSLEIEGKREEHRNRTQAIWDARDEEYRKSFAEKLSARPLNQSGGNGRGHLSGIYITPKVESGSFWYRSSWELAFALKLDQCNDVVKYEFEKIRTSFYKDGMKKFTYFDFHLCLTNGNESIVEVKPNAVALIKQDTLLAQVNWCIDNQKQYAIINNDIIDNYFDQLIQLLMNGKFDARTFIGRRPITAEIIINTIKCQS